MVLKNLRLKANLTQAQLASVLNVTQQSIAGWESGNTLPRADIIPKIADALGCTIDQLFGRGEEVEKDEG